MKDWLIHSFAFALGLGTAILLYRLAFTAAMTGASMGVAGFVFWVMVCPAVGGLVAFGVVHRLLSGRNFNLRSWLIALSFVVSATLVCGALIIAGLMKDVPSAILLAGFLFFGGGMMTIRRTHA